MANSTVRSGGRMPPTFVLSVTSIIAQPKSKLLSLPAEILNQICEETLVKDEAIDVADAEASAPALLHTSRQLRQAGSPLFFLKNKFSIRTTDNDVRPANQWFDVLVPPRFRRDVQKTLNISDIRNPVAARINLMAWFKQFFGEGSYGHCPPRARLDFETFIGGPYDSSMSGHRMAKIFHLTMKLCGKMRWKDAHEVISIALDAARVVGEP